MQKLTMHLIKSTLLLSLLFTSSSFASSVMSFKDDQVAVSWILLRQNERQIQSLLQFKVKDEWHLYWKNPGDSGAAPKFSLQGAEIKQVLFPGPKRITIEGLHNFGFENELLVPFELQLRENSQNVILDLEWLVCKVECLPGFATLSFDLNSVILTDQKDLEDLALSKIPKPLIDIRVVDSKAENESLIYTLEFSERLKLSEIQNMDVFPEQESIFKNTPPTLENPKLEKNQISLRQSLDPNRPQNFGEVTQVLRIERANEEPLFHEFRVSVLPEQLNYFWALLFAFLGGLILNVMPCVFPILSLKAFSFVRLSEPKQRRRSVHFYTLGVLVSFLLLAGILLGLRAAGESLGWGFQLQNPWIVASLMLLFIALGLNFLGVFEFGEGLAAKAAQLDQKFSSDFWTGVLAVLVASPCTAPFMGSALGLTLILPPLLSLGIFASLGLGFAAPIVLLGYSNTFAQWLPKPGPWLETFKKAMAIPLFATSLWLFYILALQLGFLGASKANDLDSAWKNFDRAQVEQLVGQRAIFVDFTAAWCVTCQVNKINVLNTDKAKQLFEKYQVETFRADWTNRDAEITKALADLGRNSVPVYVFYAKDGKRQTLPEILTYDLLEKTISENSEFPNQQEEK